MEEAHSHVSPRSFEGDGGIKRYRLHHSYIWLNALGSFLYIFLIVGASVGSALLSIFSYEEAMPSAGAYVLAFFVVLFISLLVCALVMGILAISYRCIWYEFAPGEFNYCSGVLSKKRNHIPYQRIQSVDQRTSLIQRIAGLCTVEIDTAGGQNNTAVSIKFIKREEAERIRREVFMRKQLLDSGMSAQQVHAEMQRLGSGVLYQNAAPVQPQGFGAVQQGMPGQRAPIPPFATGAPMPPNAAQSPLSPQGYVQTEAPGVSCAPMPASVQSAVQSAVSGQTAGSYATSSNVLDMPAEAAMDMRGIFGGYEVDTGTVSYEVGLSNKELLLSALTSKSSFFFVLIGVLAGVASFFSFMVDIQVVSNDDAAIMIQSALYSTAAPSLLAMVIVMFIGMIIALWVLSFIATCLHYGGFKARRRDDRIEVEHGVISHAFSGIDIDRIQTIQISQSFFQRILGYCSVSYGRVVAQGEAEQHSTSTKRVLQDALVVHPFLKKDRAYDLVARLTPEHADLPDKETTLPKKALRRVIVRRVMLQGLGFWLAVTLLLLWFVLNMLAPGGGISVGADSYGMVSFIRMVGVLWLAVCVLIAVYEVIEALLWYRLSGFGANDRYLILVNGGFSLKTVCVPRQKIQMAYVRTNPLQRISQVATINAVTAQGVGGSKECLVDVSQDDAYAWLSWARPRH